MSTSPRALLQGLILCVVALPLSSLAQDGGTPDAGSPDGGTEAAADAPVDDFANDPDLEGIDPEILAQLEAQGGFVAETVVVASPPLDTKRVAGAASKVDEEQLSRFEYVDIHRVLEKVPGIYLRGEDGFGLRPNIGLRGANSDRSSKVALMEDGILFAPAPYSAPAAYYFPSVNRLSGVEVYKGPAAIRFGPNTIGGAVNLVTRSVPTNGMVGELDLAAGLNLTGRAHGAFGYGTERYGVLIEGIHGQTEGFKQLDGGGSTGFDKNELMLKARAGTDPKAPVTHNVELKLGYATEDSDETYLGLTDADFAATPYRRYAASQRDQMLWNRSQAQLSWNLHAASGFDLKVTGYRHDFSRAWTKLNGLAGASIADVLARPFGANALYVDVLRGARNSDELPIPDSLLLGTNDRRFVSQGIQADAATEFETGPVSQLVRFGARLHHDRIERRHTEIEQRMYGGVLSDAGTEDFIARNNAWAVAGSFYAIDEILVGRLLLTPGARVEIVQTSYEEVELTKDGQPWTPLQQETRTVVLPGAGAMYHLTDHLSVLGGVYRGYSPVAPGQAAEVKPELSTNYEFGGRFGRKSTKAELVGFFNDYTNLTQTATFSGGSPESELDTQYNAGRVHVYGVELAASHGLPLPWRTILEVGATYTFTRSRFLTAFESESPQLGKVEVGYELPYVPRHQGALNATWLGQNFSFGASATYAGQMREVAGAGEIKETEGVPSHLVVDLAGSYLPTPSSEIYATVENLLNTPYLTARRPFGARPGRPLFVQVGYKHHF